MITYSFAVVLFLGNLAGFFGPEAAKDIPGLVQELHSKNADERLEAASVLGEKGKAAIPEIPELQKAIHDSDVRVRTQAAASILAISPKNSDEAMTVLSLSLGDPNSTARLTSVKAFGQAGLLAKDQIPHIAKLAFDPDPVIREESLRSLVRIDPIHPIVLDTLAKAASDIQPLVRFEAEMQIKRIGPQAISTAPNLIANLTDPISYVQKTAVEALADLGTEVVPLLINALDSKDSRVRLATVSSLHIMGADAEPATSALKLALLDDDAQIRKLAYETLLKIHTKEALKGVEIYKNEERRRQANGEIPPSESPSKK